MKNDKPAKYSSPLINKILSEIPPVQKLKTRTKMVLAARLDDILTARGWGKSEFAEKAGKNPSEVSKWLSGTHNFTMDTLVEISAALNMPVEELFVPSPEPVVNKTHVVIPVKGIQQSIHYITPMNAIANKIANYQARN